MTSLSENTVVTTSGGLVELAYKEQTFTNSITATTAATAQTLMGAVTVVCDGSPIELEVFLAGARPDTAAGNRQLYLTLLIDGSRVLDQFGLVITPAAGDVYRPTTIKRRMIPTAGVHTYEVRAYVDAGTGFIESGSTANRPMSYIRVNRIVQASQFIVPLASAPLVTSLPSAPIDGQEIRYVADATNGVIWNLRYRAASSSAYKWEFVGGAPLSASTISGITGTISSTSFVSASGGNISVSLPLAGDYWTTTTILGTNNTGGAWWMGGLDGPGSTIVDQFCARLMTSSANYFQNGAASILRTFTSSGTVDMKYRVTSGIATIAERGFSLTPIRVG